MGTSSLLLSLLARAHRFVASRRLTLAAFPFSATAAVRVTAWLSSLGQPHSHSALHYVSLTLTLLPIVALVLYITITRLRQRPVYLVDYACFRPPSSLRAPLAKYVEHTELAPCFDAKSVGFQSRLIERSGFGEETCLPPALHLIPPAKTLNAARAEAEQGIFSAVDAVLAKTGVRARDIGVVVVNCTLFAPTPSMADMVVRRYGLRSDVRCFSLSGMGCSAGIAAVGLAQNILQCDNGRAYALVVSTEILTADYYSGNERAMLLQNCLFRMGASAALLSTSRVHARYRLARVVRTHAGHDDRAYGCVQQEDDAAGERGIALSKDVMPVAGDTLTSHMATLGPLVLPASELLAYALSFIMRRVFKKDIKPYIPDFRTAFEHFCIHAGGRAVIDELQRGLGLSDELVEPSRMALHRFGNTSSSSVWYELAYLEAKGRVHEGDRVWTIGFGSGFKCNSAVWVCLRPPPPLVSGPWDGCMHRYPVPAV
uniref:Uncharacterized protein n=1 Tax=Avena sativa TaxID=4498 RepID=A0ACD5ZTW5_AVESA